MHPFCQRLRVGILLLGGCALASESSAVNLLRDINTTPNASSYVAVAAVDLANITLFVWDDGIHGQELWGSDGTPGGTRLVRDINPGPASSGIRSMVVVQGIAYFWADDGTNGVQLWRSDGTTAFSSHHADARFDRHRLRRFRTAHACRDPHNQRR